MKNVTRRNFLKASAGTAALSTLALTACSAEETDGAFKVGIVNYVDHASLNQIVAAVGAQLDALGDASGGAYSFNYADYSENANADSTTMNQIAADLIADNVDVIVAVATPVAVVMQNATEDNQIPVVYAAVSDPEIEGLTESANVTGASDALNTDAIMKLILATNPSAQKVGLLYDLSQSSSTQAIADAKAFCDANGLSYVEKNGTTTGDIMLAAETLVAEGVDAVFTPSDNTVMTAELSIYETFANAGIPHFGGADSFALNGAFCGYGVDYVQLGTETANLIAQILVDGTSPADIPYLTFDNGIATVNTEICEAIGYDIDDIRTAFEPLCTEFVETVTAAEFE